MQTCYRHPGRETGVSCSNCGRPICPECMTSTPVGMRCPECAKQKTKVKVGPGALQATDVPIATYTLIGINLLVFCLEIAKASGGIIDVTPNSLVTDGGLFGPAVADGDYYR